MSLTGLNAANMATRALSTRLRTVGCQSSHSWAVYTAMQYKVLKSIEKNPKNLM